MKKKYLVYGAIATIGAVLFYLWKKGKTEQAKEDQEKLDVESGTPRTESANVANTGTLSSTATSGVPVGLNVTRFQNWIWNNVEGKLKPVSENPKTYQSILCSNACTFDTGVDGNWGGNTLKAWNKYGKYWDISKNDPNAEGIKLFGYWKKPTATSNTAESNKKMMDKLNAYAIGKPYASSSIYSANARMFKFHFYPGTASFLLISTLPLYDWWNISFYERKNGKEKNTFSILDAKTQTIIHRGYLENLENEIFTLRFTQGSLAGKTLKDTLPKILKRATNALMITWSN